MPHDNLTNRELFQKLLEVVEKNHQVQHSTVEALKAMEEKLEAVGSKLESRIWTLLVALIAALLATIGIKLILPGL